MPDLCEHVKGKGQVPLMWNFAVNNQGVTPSMSMQSFLRSQAAGKKNVMKCPDREAVLQKS